MKKIRMVAAILTLCFVTFAFGADTYIPDAAHSTIGFKIKHLGISTVPGQFKDYTGKIVFDSATPTQSSVEFTIKIASVDTANAKRDEHLLGADFFNAEKFPTASFKSTSVKKVDDTTYEIVGDFTLLGTTKSITFTFGDIAFGKGLKGEDRAGGSARFKIKRSDYGMSKMVGPVGDDVTIELLIEAAKSSS